MKHKVNRGHKFFGWMARVDDYENHQLGNYLQDHTTLVSKKEAELHRKEKKRVSGLPDNKEPGTSEAGGELEQRIKQDMSIMKIAQKHQNAQSSKSLHKKSYACNFCMRKFYSSQALEGHQNAHKREREAARKFQLSHNSLVARSLAIKPHSLVHKQSRERTATMVAQFNVNDAMAWTPLFLNMVLILYGMEAFE
ncbi:hypothetical protein TSUD_182550 [Trifolium subterraneum]|uniref:C2H2-type domain-containing protein n=1 Tax=Trifolium subterraneum TaxID=3900 RepID=A0A2Z6LK37_TRISU|nr:hypothetical protein TSUD_182550 [Trifolium subterraneum]